MRIIEDASVNCLIISSLVEPGMQSELQELVNCLSRADYEVQVLYRNVSSLELYRFLNGHIPELVWILCHSDPEGFSFPPHVLRPSELGLFLASSLARDVVINSCYSAEHVTEIQAYAPHANIVATISPLLGDTEASTMALYLGRRLGQGKDLRTAYLETVASGNTKYRWFPSPTVGAAPQDPLIHLTLDSLADEFRKHELVARWVLWGFALLVFLANLGVFYIIMMHR